MTIRFPVEAGHIMLFARAIGESDPVYSDDEYARSTELEGIIAPPTFTEAAQHFDPDFEYRPKVGKPWFGSGREPTGVPDHRDPSGSTSFHAETHFEYHGELRPGDVVTVERRPGATWEKSGRRGGRLSFWETISEYRNQHGALLVTERTVGVRTEKHVEENG